MVAFTIQTDNRDLRFEPGAGGDRELNIWRIIGCREATSTFEERVTTMPRNDLAD